MDAIEQVQLRRLGHGFAVASGRYDDPDDPGDVSHFQALTTARSATVGIGNIAGAAWAIHYGGPGALFWMWVTAFVGMATKFAEVTLAQEYRVVDPDVHPRAAVRQSARAERQLLHAAAMAHAADQEGRAATVAG
jgi:AGCS family alanine or glycine:cation symporter